MVSERVHPPNHIVHSQADPTEGLIMAHVKSRKHPTEVRPTEAAVMGILHDILVVVPIDKAIPQ